MSPKPSKAPNPLPIASPIGLVQARFKEAVGLHQRGQLVEASARYQAILQLDPRHADSQHLLGVIALQTGHPARAVELIGKAIKLQPSRAAFHSNRGLALHGVGQFDAAIASYDKALAAQPEFPEAHCNRGNALRSVGRWSDALASYEKAVSARPSYAEALHNKGLVLHELGRFQEAIDSYEQALALLPSSSEVWYNRGNTLRYLARSDAAIESYERAIAIAPGAVDAWLNRGVALFETKRYEAAIDSYDSALSIRPDHAPAWTNRGNALQSLGRLDEAVASHTKAIGFAPALAEAYCNRGSVLVELGALDAAIESFTQAIACRPDYVDAQWGKALSLLKTGRFDEGWPQYEWRWKLRGFPSPRRDFRQPLWLGQESVEGKTVLLHSEQGLGDTIQFSRFARTVAEAGARVILEVPQPLLGLMHGLEGPSMVLPSGEDLPAFDLHCPLLSLPLALGTTLQTIPVRSGYLRVDDRKVAVWSNRLGPAVRPRVGLTWSGSVVNTNDHKRSVVLADLMTRLPQGVDYVSLQKDLRETDRPALESAQIRHFGADLADFTDTSALCHLVDLVVSVDTSVAHLSGALGRPTWILLSFEGDWRWLVDQEDSPWYASVRLYRQGPDRRWQPVFDRVAGDIARWCHLGRVTRSRHCA